MFSFFLRYGIYERCRELVEAGYDVRQPDKENVTLLHWAAINNRIDLVKYYISKGAIVDQLGGDLNSTPLHWATRQGHLSMVVQLMKYGADPSLIDGEGCSCIHLAAQFGHTSIVAYLIAKGQEWPEGWAHLGFQTARPLSFSPCSPRISPAQYPSMRSLEQGNLVVQSSPESKSRSCLTF